MTLRIPRAKRSFFRQVSRRILEFPEALERENYIEAIAGRYQIGFEQPPGDGEQRGHPRRDHEAERAVKIRYP